MLQRWEAKICQKESFASQPPGHESDTLSTEPSGWAQTILATLVQETQTCELSLINNQNTVETALNSKQTNQTPRSWMLNKLFLDDLLVSQSPVWSPSCGSTLLSALQTSNSLPNDKFLDWSNLKALADHRLKVTEKLKFVSGRVENIEGNGENAGYQHFLLFPQCVLKACFSRLLKVGIVWWSVNDPGQLKPFGHILGKEEDTGKRKIQPLEQH